MHKSLCKSMTKTVYRHKDINMHTYCFGQIYKAVVTPDSVWQTSIIVETGTHEQVSFPLLKLSIVACRNIN